MSASSFLRDMWIVSENIVFMVVIVELLLWRTVSARNYSHFFKWSIFFEPEVFSLKDKQKSPVRHSGLNYLPYSSLSTSSLDFSFNSVSLIL